MSAQQQSTEVAVQLTSIAEYSPSMKKANFIAEYSV